MNDDYWYPFYPQKHLIKTLHLSAEADGAYRRLLDFFIVNGPIRFNTGALERITGCSKVSRAFVEATSLFEVVDGFLYQEQAASIREEFLERNSYTKRRLEASRHTALYDIRRAVFSKDSFRCNYCGCGDDLTVDHIVSVVKGGKNCLSNYQTLCRACNSSKGAS